MKRKRHEMETKKTEIRSTIEELSAFTRINPEDDIEKAANIPIRPFLSVCNSIVQVLDKIGPTMAVLRQDIDQNIQRLEKLYESDPSVYSDLVEILKKERSESNAKNLTSCSRALLWLTRSMDFMVALLQRMAKDSSQSMEQVVEESYNTTLKQWHGWISSAAFKVALKLVPDKKTFMGLLAAKDEKFETLKEDIETLVSLLVPLLEGVHSLLELCGLDRLKST